jgi:REP element-mobilizing transposase RayT
MQEIPPNEPQVPRRKTLPHGVPVWVGNEAVFFVTLCCAERSRNQLCHSDTARAIFESIEFRTKRGDWYVHLALLMPDHLHALISFPRDREMRKVISQWKGIVAKRTGVCWQRDFFDHRLRADESFEEKAHYIRMNPVRVGLAALAAEWTFVWQPP